jgi:hypothetical protein
MKFIAELTPSLGEISKNVRGSTGVLRRQTPGKLTHFIATQLGRFPFITPSLQTFVYS